jgi:hypothetical protein
MKSHPRSSTSGHFHAVRFYDDDQSLCRIVAGFLRDALLADQPAIVIATPSHRAEIAQELNALLPDRSGDLLMLDADETLATFMVNDKPDAARFSRSMGKVIARACGGRTDCIVRAYGEMVDILWKRGNREGAIRLETLWNVLATSHKFSLLCGYAICNFYKDAGFEDVCGQHTHVISENGQAAVTGP